MLVRRGVLDGKRMDSGGYDYVMKYSVPTHVISSETDPIRIAETIVKVGRLSRL
jgi:hypothetical protein